MSSDIGRLDRLPVGPRGAGVAEARGSWLSSGTGTTTVSYFDEGPLGDFSTTLVSAPTRPGPVSLLVEH